MRVRKHRLSELVGGLVPCLLGFVGNGWVSRKSSDLRHHRLPNVFVSLLHRHPLRFTDRWIDFPPRISLPIGLIRSWPYYGFSHPWIARYKQIYLILSFVCRCQSFCLYNLLFTIQTCILILILIGILFGGGALEIVGYDYHFNDRENLQWFSLLLDSFSSHYKIHTIFSSITNIISAFLGCGKNSRFS